MLLKKTKKFIIFFVISLGLISPVNAGSFPSGWCTYGVSVIKGGIPWSGNAKDWYNNAKKMNIQVAPGNASGSNDRRGAIVVFGPHSANGRMGHVAVSLGGGKFIEMNGKGPCNSQGKCASFNKFVESNWPIGGGAPIIGYIYYKMDKTCPPQNAKWLDSHPSCP